MLGTFIFAVFWLLQVANQLLTTIGAEIITHTQLLLLWNLLSDTKLLLTKNYFEIIIFEKLRIPRVISGKSLSFLEILRVQIPSKITKNNSQGIIFVIISCQRVFCNYAHTSVTQL